MGEEDGKFPGIYGRIMKLITFMVIYLIGGIISSIIFARFVFKYNDPKDCFGLSKPDAACEQKHYELITLFSWVYPFVWICIIVYLIGIASVNFVKYISKL